MKNNYNLETEKELLGTIFHYPDILLDIDLQPSDFCHARHQRIFELCRSLYEEEGAISLNHLADVSQGRLKVTDLVQISESAGVRGGVGQLVKNVRDKSVLRKVVVLGDELVRAKENPIEILKNAEVKILDLMKFGELKKNASIKDVAHRTTETFSEVGKQRQLGLRIGIGYLDRAVVAYIPTTLWIIGAWTSVGKSTLMWEMVRRVYEHNDNPRVMVASVEMSDEINLLKLVANYTEIPVLNILQWHNHTDETRKKILDCMAKISGYNLAITDDLMDWDSIYMRAKKEKLINGLDLLFVDFVQNLQENGSIYDRMSSLAPRMQSAAKALNCTIIAMSQVSNEEADADGLVKFKGAGELGAACDVGIRLLRHKEKKSRDYTKNLTVHIQKNRLGLTGHSEMIFNDNYTRLLEA